jgi:hypothetical protein
VQNVQAAKAVQTFKFALSAQTVLQTINRHGCHLERKREILLNSFQERFLAWGSKMRREFEALDQALSE